MVTFFIALAIYISTASGQLFGGDSAEYSTIHIIGGIAHPPGYPLYSLLQYLFRVFDVSIPHNIAASLLSFIPMALTCLVTYKILEQLRMFDKWMARLITVFFAILFPVWLYSIVPEVFGLHMLFVSFSTWLIIRFNKTRLQKYSYWYFLMIGLMTVHHQIYIFFLPAWYVLLKNRKSFIRDHFWKKLLVLCTGLLFYAYVPLSSILQHPPIEYENQQTLLGILKLFFRTTYGTFKPYGAAQTNLIMQTFNMFSIFVYILMDFKIMGILFALVGIFTLKRKHSGLFGFVITALISHIVFLFYLNFTLQYIFQAAIFERFLIPVYWIVIFPMYYGLIWLKDKLNTLPFRFSGLIVYLAFFSLIVLTGVNYYRVFSAFKAQDFFDSFAKNILSTPPKNSIIVTSSDNGAFTTRYYYFALKYRPDLEYVHLGLITHGYYQQTLKQMFPHLKFPKTNKDSYLLDFIKLNSSKGIYAESPSFPGTWVPYGLMWKYYPSEDVAKKDYNSLNKINEKLWQSYKIPVLTSRLRTILHFQAIQQTYLNDYLSFAKFLLIQKKIKEATAILQTITKISDGNNPALNLLLYTLSENNQCDQAKKLFQTYEQKFQSDTKQELAQQISYYYYCDPKNPKANGLINQYKTAAENQDIPLNRL